MNNKLILRSLESPFSDITKNSKLTIADGDNNFIFLKGSDLSAATTTGTVLSLIKNNGEIINVDISSVSGGTGQNTAIVSGTFSNETLTLYNTTGGTVVVTGITSSGGSSGLGVFVTGATVNNNNKTYTFTNNTGGTFVVTGLTDINIISGLYSGNTIILTNNTGGTVSITGITSISQDTYITGATGNNGNKTYTFTNNTGGTFVLSALTDITIVSGVYNNGTLILNNNTGGTITITGLTASAGTDTYVTGATTNNGNKTYTFTNNLNQSFVVTGLTDLTITGGNYTNGTLTLNNNTGGTFSITGFSTGSTIFTTQTKNTFFSGPISGTSVPTFRPLNDFDFPLRNKLKHYLLGNPNAFGDSYTIGLQASPITESYINKLSAMYNVPITNFAAGGTGVWYSCQLHFQAVRRDGTYHSSIWMAGFNDLRRGGATSNTISKIKGCLRSAIANQFIKICSAASVVTNTGTWSNITGIGSKSQLSVIGSTRMSSTSGDSLTYTSPVSTNIVIGTFNTDGTIYNYGRFTVSIDGVIVQTFDPNNRTDAISDGIYDNGRTQEVLVFENLRNTTHSVIITLLDNKPTIIDYFGVLDSPLSNAPFFCSSIPHLTSIGYATGVDLNASDAVMDAADVAIQTVIDEFIYRPVVYVPLNNYFNPYTDIDVDNVHPSTIGHTHIAQAFQAKINNGLPKVVKLQSLNSGFVGGLIFQNNGSMILTVNRNDIGTPENASIAEAQLSINTANGDSNFEFYTSSTNATTPTLAFKVYGTGNVNTMQKMFLGGVTVPTAVLHIKAGLSTVGNAPFKYTSGVSGQTSIENGAKNYDGSNEYIAVSGVNYTIAKTLTTVSTLDFPLTSGNTSSDLTVSLIGARLNDVVNIGVPDVSIMSNSSYFGWVSSADTVTIRFNNYDTISKDPTSGTFRISITKY